MNTDFDLYSRAINAARNELQSIRAEYDRLAKRKAQLEAFIANGEPLIPEGPQPALAFPLPVKPAGMFGEPVEDSPLWKSIVLGINGKRDGFTVKDALAALERMGRPVESKNRFQIVRAVLVRKTEVFRRLSVPGMYAVNQQTGGAQMQQ